MNASDIRSTFLKFFESKGHQIVASSPVVPGDDPTLLFTNAGMNQFKDVFLGFDKRPYSRAATSQKCIRAGGKHNDLENVGYTARHHTFFEMLGNFSFGDYFKHDAIQYAWELLTVYFKLPKDKLWATVYAEDDEAYDIWLKVIGLPAERIVRIGDNASGRYMSDNFWMMGDTGPCGPSSEIFFDHGPEVAGGPPGSAEQDGDRYIEVWNNVFMQFNRTEDGVMHKLPKDKLWATVYAEDDEAYDIWLKVIGLPPERIVRIGDNKGGRYMSDNFWMMGDTGPCGPCSEIFFDHGPEVAGGPPGSAEQDGDRYIEIWNNVFMQFNRTEDGVMHKLPKPSVDTGMGLERLAAVLQHVHSNYEIDMFVRLLAAAKTAVQLAAGGADIDAASPSLKVIADHIRACTFTVVDGVIPGNEGRGYVLRRIARRGIRHGYKLGARKPFFYTLVAPLAAEMGEAYPELRRDMVRATEVLKVEEERFFQTIANGMEILETALAGGAKVIAGDIAFKLHDTFGFPLDLTADVCRERGVKVDETGFNAAMTRQREQARAAGKFRLAQGLAYSGADTTFHGYEHLVCEHSKVTAIYIDGSPVPRAKAGDDATVVLDHTPFYAESGGQVGDTGELRNAKSRVLVEDTIKVQAAVHGHQGRIVEGEVEVGDTVVARVDGERRARTVRNHSATHLMHKALREVLGAHVQQKGSLVNADRTRFDFAHNAPVSDAQVVQIENIVNAEILANAAAASRVLPIEEAQKLGAMMLFGEKYGDQVRVLDIGSSRELCGGTHVQRTGDIGLFKIVAEGGVAAGIRRVEAVTGSNALAYLQQLEGSVNGLAGTLKATPAEVPSRVAAVLEQVRALEKEVESLKSRLASSQGGELLTQAVDVNGVKVVAAMLQGADAKALRETVDRLKDKLKSAAIVLAAVEGGKVQLAAGATTDVMTRVKAGELVNFVAQQVGGKGGGKADLAMAGGTDAVALPAALASVVGWVRAKL